MNREASKGIKREDLNKIDRDIAKAAKKDEKQHLIEQFNENSHDANKNKYGNQ